METLSETLCLQRRQTVLQCHACTRYCLQFCFCKWSGVVLFFVSATQPLEGPQHSSHFYHKRKLCKVSFVPFANIQQTIKKEELGVLTVPREGLVPCPSRIASPYTACAGVPHQVAQEVSKSIQGTLHGLYERWGKKQVPSMRSLSEHSLIA